MKKSPAKSSPARRKNAGNLPPRPGWLSKVKLAGALGIGRGTIYRYLDKAGAPQPDDRMRYELEAVKAFISSQGSANVADSGLQKIRQEKLQLEVEEMRRDAARKSGELVKKSEIAPTLKAMFAQLTSDLRQEFEEVLPPKYKGKGTVDCKLLNAAAVDRTLLALARGCWSLGADVPAPGGAAAGGAAGGAAS